ALPPPKGAIGIGVRLAALRRPEEPIEEQPRIDLLGDWRRLTAPREVRLVGAAIAVIAFPGVPTTLAADLQGGEARGRADLAGGELVDGNPGLEVCAVRLARVATGQEAGHGPRVITAAVAQCPRRVQR